MPPSRRSSMPLLKDGKLAEDSWRPLSEDGAMPQGDLPGGDVIVTLEQWQAGRERLRGHHGRLGLRLKRAQSPAGIAEDLGHLPPLALQVPPSGGGREHG